MLTLFFLQLICLFVYIAKKLKSLKNFMLNFKDKNSKDSKVLSLNKKNNNNNSITNTLDNSKEKNLKDNSEKNKTNINKNNLKNKKRMDYYYKASMSHKNIEAILEDNKDQDEMSEIAIAGAN